MKILIGEINQESNTFSPLRTTLHGAHREIGSRAVAGFVSEAKAEGVECVSSLFMKMTSSGMFAAPDFEELKGLLVSQVKDAMARAGRIDGVLFSLHGAMVAESCDDVEGELTGLIRKELGSEIPFVITLDPHANVTRRMVSNVNAIVGYKTYPHVDLFETGQAAAKLIFSILRDGIVPEMALCKIPMIVPAENSQSTHGPFADLLAEAESGVRRGDSIMTSLFPTQPWIDVKELGFSVTVVATDKEKAEREAGRLAALIWKKRHEFDVELHRVGEVLNLALREAGAPGGPIVASNSSDSPGAGSCGDGNFILKQLLDLQLEDKLTCFLEIIDAPAVAKAIEAGVGKMVELGVGHSLSRLLGEPFSVCGRVANISEGIFGLKSLGRTANMGRAVVLRIGKISLLIHESPVPSVDPAMYRSVGLDLMEADLVVVRSAMQFRAEYESIARRIFIVDTPGFSPANLKALSFSKIERPFFPFDDDFEPAICSEY